MAGASPVVMEATPTLGVHVHRAFLLAPRLAQVQGRYAPLSRACLKGRKARRIEAQRPVVRAPALKKSKTTVLPTTIAVRNLNRRPTQTAAVIHFPAAAKAARTSPIRRAA